MTRRREGGTVWMRPIVILMYLVATSPILTSGENDAKAVKYGYELDLPHGSYSFVSAKRFVGDGSQDGGYQNSHGDWESLKTSGDLVASETSYALATPQEDAHTPNGHTTKHHADKDNNGEKQLYRETRYPRQQSVNLNVNNQEVTLGEYNGNNARNNPIIQNYPYGRYTAQEASENADLIQVPTGVPRSISVRNTIQLESKPAKNVHLYEVYENTDEYNNESQKSKIVNDKNPAAMMTEATYPEDVGTPDEETEAREHRQVLAINPALSFQNQNREIYKTPKYSTAAETHKQYKQYVASKNPNNGVYDSKDQGKVEDVHIDAKDRKKRKQIQFKEMFNGKLRNQNSVSYSQLYSDYGIQSAKDQIHDIYKVGKNKQEGQQHQTEATKPRAKDNGCVHGTGCEPLQVEHDPYREQVGSESNPAEAFANHVEVKGKANTFIELFSKQINSELDNANVHIRSENSFSPHIMNSDKALYFQTSQQESSAPAASTFSRGITGVNVPASPSQTLSNGGFQPSHGSFTQHVKTESTQSAQNIQTKHRNVLQTAVPQPIQPTHAVYQHSLHSGSSIQSHHQLVQPGAQQVHHQLLQPVASQQTGHRLLQPGSSKPVQHQSHQPAQSTHHQLLQPGVSQAVHHLVQPGAARLNHHQLVQHGAPQSTHQLLQPGASQPVQKLQQHNLLQAGIPQSSTSHVIHPYVLQNAASQLTQNILPKPQSLLQISASQPVHTIHTVNPHIVQTGVYQPVQTVLSHPQHTVRTNTSQPVYAINHQLLPAKTAQSVQAHPHHVLHVSNPLPAQTVLVNHHHVLQHGIPHPLQVNTQHVQVGTPRPILTISGHSPQVFQTVSFKTVPRVLVNPQISHLQQPVNAVQANSHQIPRVAIPQPGHTIIANPNHVHQIGVSQNLQNIHSSPHHVLETSASEPVQQQIPQRGQNLPQSNLYATQGTSQQSQQANVADSHDNHSGSSPNVISTQGTAPDSNSLPNNIELTASGDFLDYDESSFEDKENFDGTYEQSNMASIPEKNFPSRDVHGGSNKLKIKLPNVSINKHKRKIRRTSGKPVLVISSVPLFSHKYNTRDLLPSEHFGLKFGRSKKSKPSDQERFFEEYKKWMNDESKDTNERQVHDQQVLEDRFSRRNTHQYSSKAHINHKKDLLNKDSTEDNVHTEHSEEETEVDK